MLVVQAVIEMSHHDLTMASEWTKIILGNSMSGRCYDRGLSCAFGSWSAGQRGPGEHG